MKLGLDRLHDLVSNVAAAPGEPYGLLLVSVGRVYKLRAIVGREVVAHAEERDLELAAERVVDQLEDREGAGQVLAACGR